MKNGGIFSKNSLKYFDIEKVALVIIKKPIYSISITCLCLLYSIQASHMRYVVCATLIAPEVDKSIFGKYFSSLRHQYNVFPKTKTKFSTYTFDMILARQKATVDQLKRVLTRMYLSRQSKTMQPRKQ